MKQRIFALVALIVSLAAFSFAVAMYSYTVANEFNNNSGYIVQLVGVGLIVLICAVNYILALQKTDNKDNKDEQENPKD